jgi:hypothetical protein
MADARMIPYLEALANQVSQYANSYYNDPDLRYSTNSQLVAPIAKAMEAKYGHNWQNTLKSNIGLEDFYATAKAAGLNDDAWMQARGQGWVDSGYRPGMDLPQYQTSQLQDVVEFATPPALLAGMAFGGNALFGAPGAAAGTTASLMPAAVPESAATLAEWGLTEVAPGVWSAGAAGAGAGVGSAAGAGAASGGSSASGGAAAGGAAGGAAAGGAAAKASIFDKVLGSPALLGMAGGALLGGMGGSGEVSTQTTEEGLPDWLKAYAKPALDQYGTQLQNYNVDPYGIMPAASKQFSDTISGMYLDPSTNKYLTDYFNAGAERVKGTLSPSFGHMQAFGSHTGYNEALAGGLTDLATGLYGGAYENERNRQSQMTAAAPNFLQSQSQAAFSPYQNYLSTISGLGRKKEQPFYQPGQLQGVLGGAMAGYGLGGLFK